MHKVEHLLTVVADVATKSAVIKRAQRLEDAIYHRWAEDSTALKYCSLTLKAVGRGGAAIRQLCQTLQLILVLLEVDIHVHIGALSDIECIVELEAIAAGNS